MFSKEEARTLREDFWISFGKSFPTKWTLYHTKIKDFAFKFSFNKKEAIVSIDITSVDLEKRITLWEKVASLKTVLTSKYISELQFEDCYILENQKEISRVYITLSNVSIYNKNTWQETMMFFNTNMNQLELFFEEYKDYLEA